jgi:hypothetical protein
VVAGREEEEREAEREEDREAERVSLWSLSNCTTVA